MNSKHTLFLIVPKRELRAVFTRKYLAALNLSPAQPALSKTVSPVDSAMVRNVTRVPFASKALLSSPDSGLVGEESGARMPVPISFRPRLTLTVVHCEFPAVDADHHLELHREVLQVFFLAVGL